jgi:hypothetical protein
MRHRGKSEVFPDGEPGLHAIRHSPPKWEAQLRGHFAVLSVLALVSACSGESREQIASTTVMGGALGIPGGPIGIAVGTVVGAIAGVIMPEGALDNEQAKTN